MITAGGILVVLGCLAFIAGVEYSLRRPAHAAYAPLAAIVLIWSGIGLMLLAAL